MATPVHLVLPPALLLYLARRLSSTTLTMTLGGTLPWTGTSLSNAPSRVRVALVEVVPPLYLALLDCCAVLAMVAAVPL